MEVQIIDTKRGKPAILYSGYRFTMKTENKNSTIRWICANRRCPGAILTSQGYTILEEKSHTCVPDIAKNDVDVCLDKARKRASEELLPIPQIYQQELMQVRDAGLDFVVNIPPFKSVKDRLYRQRHRALGIDVLPKQRQAVFVTQEMQKYVLIDDGQEDRILVFAGDRGQLLRQGSEFFMDGTFRSCCSLFDQLYTVHVDLGNTDTCVIPAVYALLPNRKAVTYERLFKLLHEATNFSPAKVHIDFEQAAIKAISQVFPSAVVKGCNFHFNQALWRKVQELGLVAAYTENREIRNHIRMCSALAHLPEEVIPEAWLLIMENSPNEDAVVRFNDYFVEQWLEGDPVWVCYKEKHRTTNSVEAWHSRLNKRVGKAHPNIYELMKIIEEEIVCYENYQKQYDLHLNTPKRAKKYSDLDIRIEKTLADLLDNRVSLYDTLKKLMYIIKLN